MDTIHLDGNSLTPESFSDIVSKKTPVKLSDAARALMKKSRAHVDKAAKGNTRVYSINTGFGVLSRVPIDANKLDELQVNLVRSHCCGVGEPHSEEESRGMLLLRANVLAKGFSGVRPEVADLLCEMLNKKVHPVIPSKGSVGASGDLAPLAHIAAVLIGEGEAFYDGNRMAGGTALQKAGLQPVRLGPKEGLSLINGTQQMTAVGALVLKRAERIADLADLICSASLDSILGTSRAYVDWVHQTRAHDGQAHSAKLLSSLCQESEIYESHLNCDRVQDPYSFRCAPQVHGAARDLMSYCRKVLSTEMNSSTDNPLVNPDTGELVSGGNFHGQPVAFALDILAMGISELGSLSERRISKLIDPAFSELPCFLVKNEGLNSGLMMTQVTAAALVSENKLLTHPSSTDSIPTNNEKEDHVSMGPFAARKAKTILENVETILGIEAITACQALEFRKPLKPNRGGRYLLEMIRSEIPVIEEDRVLSGDMEKATLMIRDGRLFDGAVKKGLFA